MFNNVGKKIKTLAVIMFVSFVILTTVLAGVVAGLLITANDDTMWIVMGIFSFILIETIGILISWLSVLKQYAFGELVDTNQTQVRQNNAIIELLGGEKISASNPQIEKIKHNKHYINNNIGAMDIPSETYKKEN